MLKVYPCKNAYLSHGLMVFLVAGVVVQCVVLLSHNSSEPELRRLCVCVFFKVLRFSPPSQKHAVRWIDYNNLFLTVKECMNV